ncbi:HNH endonuclease signature motif containing protein, partial [Microbacterium sp. B19(2022)]|uniref:HNH endonuclease signature motif containing protein n=1 Tax=Microbacterium sp. B19(2022) TaxID=2914045 RepID=UPI00197C90C1
GRVVRAAKAVRREVGLSSGAWLPARWPALREALVDGTIGVAGLLAAIGPIEQAGSRIGTADRLRADAELAAYARGFADADAEPDAGGEVGPAATAEDLRLLAQVIVQYLDPDGAEPADDIAMRVRGLTLGRAKDGVIPIRGRLLPEVAGQLQRLFDAYLNPKVDGPPVPGVVFRPTGETNSETNSTTNSETNSETLDDAGMDDDALPSGDPGRMVDTRSRSQKQHDTLAAILGIAARHDDTPRLGGSAPTLIVSITADDYTSGRGWAHVDGIDTPVSTRVAAHTACAGGVQRVLFDPHGRIIGISTTDRIFTVHQRRAITLRDRECLIPGCHVPATWCEIHHVTEHARGGPTHTDNGVALCWHHHRTLDTSGWEIRMRHGTPHVRGPAWWDPARRWRTPQPATPRPATPRPATPRTTTARPTTPRTTTPRTTTPRTTTSRPAPAACRSTVLRA